MKVIQQLALLSATTLFSGVSAKVGAGTKQQNGPEERDLFWNPPAKPVGQPNKYQELTCTIGGPVIYTELLLEYASPFDDTFCASVPALEAEFVESYNTLARLHCDSKCHRRAVKAKFVTKFCGGGEKDDKKKKKSKKGKRERELAETLSSDNTVIVLLELDQKVPEPGSKGCSSALDAADSDKAFQSESEYSSICGFPARDHEYYDDKYYLGKEDFKSYAEYYYYKNVDGFCCCVNGSDQDLSETDLLTIFVKYTTLGALPHAWASISELESQAMCDASTDKFGDFLYRASYERVILTEYSSKEPIFIPHTLDALTTVITELYNGFSLDGCDKFGRQIFDAKTETVYASSEGMLNPLMPTFDSTHYGDGAGQCGGFDDPDFLPGQAVARFHCPGDVCRVCECDQDIVVTATGVLCVDPPARRLGATGQAENLEYAPHAYVKAFFQSAGVDRSQATKVAVKEEEVKHEVASENAKSEEARHEEDDERDLQVGNGSILYANDFPQGKCQGGACTKTQAFVRADCKSNICPGNADFCMICETGLRDDIFSVRRLEGETHSFEVDFGPDGRMLSFWDSVMHYDTTLDMIFDKCLCLSHERKSFTLTDVSTFTTHFANEIKGKREFWGIGLPKNVTEYVPFPVAGPNDDKHLTVPVYFEGKLCDKNDQISYDRIDELLLLIARSYNDMVIEDCDWPLFRQMVEVGLDTKFDDYIHKFYCAQAEFQFNVVLTHRCHGTCKPSLEDRLFAQGYLTGHKWQTRHLKAGKTGNLGEDTRMTLKQDPPRSSQDVVEAADSEPASKTQERELYYAPTVEGLCSLEKLYDPMPPTLDGWATNANTFAPDHVKYVDILFGQPQLCRCEFKGEYLYKSGYVSKDKLQVWNGFPVIPMSDPFCKDEYTTPVPYAADPHYFTAQLFYCPF